ncbi:MAG: fasciclin domain-containing protein [Tannerella sp.]|jgi:uncharacterized surface protein with fasciclin (FAS1) repeats|nr:fasciclin domain-containing protein [Tannerella sp.]
MKTMPIVLLVSFCFCACEDRMQEHYEIPAWLKGSAWKVLEDRGNFSIFLKGVELAGYKSMLEGKSILTVMAPDDAAFTKYLSENNYPDISEMSRDELNKLIGFHLLYYSYNKERMVNFRPEGDGIADKDKDVNAGLYYKFRTRSANAATSEIDRQTGKHVTVYHLERFLPVFSYRFFATKEIDAKANYEYFYPNSVWTGDDGFNVSNASVTEYGIIADNGFIYLVDKVLHPLETIYTELEKRDNYLNFFNLYDNYSAYEYDATLSGDYGKAIGADSLYLHRHGSSLPPIAMEWPVSSYQAVNLLSSVSYSVFAPSNNALNAFFERFWEKGDYESLWSIDPLVMKHLMNQFVYGGSIVFPEEITSGKIKNSYGVPFNFDPAKVTDKAICINGNFYGMDEINTPPLFASVAGPAFRDKKRAGYLYMLDGSGLLNAYVSNNAEFTLLIPNDSVMNENGIFLNSYTTDNVLEEETADGLAPLSSSKMQAIVNMHTVLGKTELKHAGTQVCATQSAFNYWYIKDGAIANNVFFNNLLNPDYTGTPFVPFRELTNEGNAWSNGRAYEYDSKAGLFLADDSDGLIYALAVCNDSRYPYYEFAQLLKKAGLVLETTIPMLQGSRFVAFIPTNEAIKAAAGNIPENTTQLRNYLESYFLRSIENVFTNYPYPGSTFRSNAYTTPNGKKINYTDSGVNLSVELDGSGVKANVNSRYDFFPFAFHDGCFHLINTTF